MGIGKKYKFSEYWLFLLIIVQPLLDVLAFWTSSEAGTAAGYIRLLVMVALPVYLLIREDNKKPLVIGLGIIAAIALLHVGNLFRVGYVNFFGDVKNMAKIFYLPVMSVCLCVYVRDENKRKQIVSGLAVNVAIIAAIIVISYLTGTYTPTYGKIGGKGPILGISAWVIFSNRNAHSIILCFLSIFATYLGISAKKPYIRYFMPALVFLGCATNGTTSAYLTLLACMAGYAIFLVFSHIVRKERMQRATVLLLIYLIALFTAAVVFYPESPQAKITAIEKAAADKRQKSLEDELMAMGYDIKNMSPEEKKADPVVLEKMADFYRRNILGGAPGLLENFDIYRIMDAYDMSTDAMEIIDVRKMKRVNAHLIWEDSDLATKLLGFEFEKVDWPEETLDLENDWHSIFYYYGVLGFGAYALYMLYFIFLVLRKLRQDFKGSMTVYNFCLIMGFFVLIGLAHFSGALLKRPNSAIYLAMLLALLNYQTCYAPNKPGEDMIL
ncbi:MAG: O-antigen ligase family protein [Oscillospiraceae bacterium]|nr:O-antigen ligase family protein [Oscillospiraceae bacterium]